MRTIPKIIHLQWWQGFTHSSFPKKYISNLESIIEKNPDYRIIYWDENSIRELLKNYPEYLKKLDEFKFLHQKVDLARIAVLHIFGGASTDVDVEALKSFNETPNISESEFILSKNSSSKMENLIAHGRTEHLNNATILVKPNHPLLKEYLDFLLTVNCPVDANSLKCLQATTGPETFSDFFLQFKDRITILPNSFFESCNGWDDYCPLPPEIILNHKHEGSWLSEYKSVGKGYYAAKNFLKNYWWVLVLIILSIIFLRRTNFSKTS